MGCKALFGVIDNHDWHYVESLNKNMILVSFGLSPSFIEVGTARQVHHRVCLKCKTIDNQIAKFKAECVRRKRELEERDRLAREIIVASEAKERENQLHKGQQDG